MRKQRDSRTIIAHKYNNLPTLSSELLHVYRRRILEYLTLFDGCAWRVGSSCSMLALGEQSPLFFVVVWRITWSCLRIRYFQTSYLRGLTCTIIKIWGSLEVTTYSFSIGLLREKKALGCVISLFDHIDMYYLIWFLLFYKFVQNCKKLYTWNLIRVDKCGIAKITILRV